MRGRKILLSETQAGWRRIAVRHITPLIYLLGGINVAQRAYYTVAEPEIQLRSLHSQLHTLTAIEDYITRVVITQKRKMYTLFFLALAAHICWESVHRYSLPLLLPFLPWCAQQPVSDFKKTSGNFFVLRKMHVFLILKMEPRRDQTIRQ